MSEANPQPAPAVSEGDIPSLAAVLHGREHLGRLPLVALLRADQRRRWQAGQRVPAETYLHEIAALRDDPELAIDLIFSEFLLRRDILREAPGLEEYLARFPQHARDLQCQLALDGLGQDATHHSAFLDAANEARGSDEPTVLMRGGRQSGTPVAGAPALPGYEVLGELGRGGMGVVYKAREIELNRLVALKVIRGEALADSSELARFRVEATAAARLQHPNIVRIYQVGASSGWPYLALEYVDGGNLAQWVGGTPQSPHRAAQLAEVLARAIQHAHERGILHRDLKPANILMQTTEHTENAGKTLQGPFLNSITSLGSWVPKITDFGLAKFLDTGSCLHAPEGQTKTGAVLGTPGYMAPELAEGRVHEAGPAADIYALGAILYEMLTGRPPFLGESPLETLLQVRSLDPVPPRRLQPKVPRDLQTICLKCLEKEPRRRYASAGALADDLHRFLADEPIKARPPGWLARFRLWSRRPERIHDAGAFMVFLGVGCSLWCLSGIGFITAGAMRPPEVGRAILQLAIFIALYYVPPIFIGLGTMARRTPWLWSGVLVAALDFVVTIFNLVGANAISELHDVGGIHSNPNVRLPVFSGLGMLTGVQFFVYCLAVRAHYANRRTVR
jgi:serine/threonine protein kinase